MIQSRNQYLHFMLVMLAAWGISWGARLVMVLFWCTCCVFSWYTAIG